MTKDGRFQAGFMGPAPVERDLSLAEPPASRAATASKLAATAR